MAGKRAAYRDHAQSLRAVLQSKTGPAAAGVTLIYGMSEYLLGEAVQRLRSEAAASGTASSAVEATTLTEASLAALASQRSLFEPRILYVLRRCEAARNLAKLLKGVPPLSPGSNHLCFVLAGEGPSAPLRTELTRLGAHLVPCFDPWPNDVPQVLLAMAADLGIKLRSDAVQLLLDANGLDLVKHANELRKLSFLVGAGGDARTVSASDLAPLLGMLREDDRYALDQLLLSRQWAKAQALAGNLLERGESALALLGLLSSHCRNSLRIASALARGLQPPTIAGELGLPPFVVKLYVQHRPRAADLPRYVRALSRCQEADVAMKATRLAKDLLVAEIIDVLATA